MTIEKEAEKYEEAVTAIGICKEVVLVSCELCSDPTHYRWPLAQGLRIIADFCLGDLMLYPEEKAQFAESSNLKPTLEMVAGLTSGGQVTTQYRNERPQFPLAVK